MSLGDIGNPTTRRDNVRLHAQKQHFFLSENILEERFGVLANFLIVPAITVQVLEA